MVPALAGAGAAVVLALPLGFLAGRMTAPAVPVATPTPVVVVQPASPLPTNPVAEASPAETAVVEAPVSPMPVPPTPRAVIPTPTATVVALIPPTTPKALPTPAATATPGAKRVTLADALALKQEGKIDDAITALEGIVKAEPANAEAHWALASAYRVKRKGPKACAEFRGYAKNTPKGDHAADARRHLAVCDAVTLIDQGKLDEAYSAFQSIVRANWTFADGHYWLGTMQALKNENAAACTSFKSYQRLDGKGPYSERSIAQLAALGC